MGDQLTDNELTEAVNKCFTLFPSSFLSIGDSWPAQQLCVLFDFVQNYKYSDFPDKSKSTTNASDAQVIKKVIKTNEIVKFSSFKQIYDIYFLEKEEHVQIAKQTPDFIINHFEEFVVNTEEEISHSYNSGRLNPFDFIFDYFEIINDPFLAVTVFSSMILNKSSLFDRFICESGSLDVFADHFIPLLNPFDAPNEPLSSSNKVTEMRIELLRALTVLMVNYASHLSRFEKLVKTMFPSLIVLLTVSNYAIQINAFRSLAAIYQRSAFHVKKNVKKNWILKTVSVCRANSLVFPLIINFITKHKMSCLQITTLINIIIHNNSSINYNSPSMANDDNNINDSYDINKSSHNNNENIELLKGISTLLKYSSKFISRHFSPRNKKTIPNVASNKKCTNKHESPLFVDLMRSYIQENESGSKKKKKPIDEYFLKQINNNSSLCDCQTCSSPLTEGSRNKQIDISRILFPSATNLSIDTKISETTKYKFNLDKTDTSKDDESLLEDDPLGISNPTKNKYLDNLTSKANECTMSSHSSLRSLSGEEDPSEAFVYLFNVAFENPLNGRLAAQIILESLSAFSCSLDVLHWIQFLVRKSAILAAISEKRSKYKRRIGVAKTILQKLALESGIMYIAGSVEKIVNAVIAANEGKSPSSECSEDLLKSKENSIFLELHNSFENERGKKQEKYGDSTENIDNITYNFLTSKSSESIDNQRLKHFIRFSIDNDTDLFLMDHEY